jgi:hypothetical protein
MEGTPSFQVLPSHYNAVMHIYASDLQRFDLLKLRKQAIDL